MLVAGATVQSSSSASDSLHNYNTIHHTYLPTEPVAPHNIPKRWAGR